MVRVPLSWLREFVDWQDGSADLAAALTSRGVAVEAIEQPGVGAARIVASRILAVEAHPESPDLHICRVRAHGHTATVVCGAPGVAAGQLVPWAPPGSVLPDGRAIAVQPVRGVPSEGMLCAAADLGLPGGHAGLLDLGQEACAEGEDLVGALHLDEAILVLELTPNYAAHCQSILGVAREVAALTGAALRSASGPPTEDQRRTSASAATVRIEAPALCCRYVARVLGGLQPRPTPLRMAQRLVQCGMRPVSAVVDVTNYVLLELGQPLHAFDLHALVGGGVAVRRAAQDERIITLDGREHGLTDQDLVIADAEGPVAIAGVMGGQRTEVRADTTAVLLESAAFAAASVARTAGRLGLPSEAAARFGRGVDPGIARAAADRAAGLLQVVCGATVFAGAVEAGPGAAERSIVLRGRRARALLGVRLSTSACGRQLERFGFHPRADGPDRLRVTVPSWRPDVTLEVDLIEEVARAYGYDRIEALLPPGEPGVPLSPPARVEAVRAVALGAGYSEVQPYSYHGTDAWDLLLLPAEHPWRSAVAIANPMSRDQAVLRVSLAPGLLGTLAVNARRQRADTAVFEVGRVFLRSAAGGRPEEPLMLGVAGYGALQPATWDRPAAPCDFFAIKGLFEESLRRLGGDLHGPQWERGDGRHPFLHPGRCAQWRTGERVLAWLGETHPAVTAAYDLPGPAVVGEVDLGVLETLGSGGTTVQPLPRFPAVRRDLAVLVPPEVPAAGVEATIRAAGGAWLTDVRLFDVYAGLGAAEGQRSLAYALTYQAEHTLTDQEVAGAHGAVREAVAALPGVTLRS